MNPVTLFAASAAILWATGAIAQTAVTRGRAIAEQQCSPCHAIGPAGQSPLAKAPPLRTISAKYPLENLEEAFAEGIMVSHNSPEMPAFEMEPDKIANLIAYLKSLAPRRR